MGCFYTAGKEAPSDGGGGTSRVDELKDVRGGRSPHQLCGWSVDSSTPTAVSADAEGLLRCHPHIHALNPCLDATSRNLLAPRRDARPGRNLTDCLDADKMSLEESKPFYPGRRCHWIALFLSV